MSELNAWLSTRHPRLLAEYDRQRREHTTQLGRVGWLIFYHADVWHQWQGTRVVIVKRAEKIDA